MSGTLHGDLITFILLAATYVAQRYCENTLLHFHDDTLNIFILLTQKVLLRFCDNSGYANTSQCYIIRTLPFVFPNYLDKL